MAAKSPPAASSHSRNRTATVTYPYHTLSGCLEIAKGVCEIGNGRKDVSRSLLASHLKLDEKSGDFAAKLASTKCYGLIDGRSDYNLTELSKKYFFPTENAELQMRKALLDAARCPGAFSFLLDRYDGSKPPSQELLGNVLATELGLPESWKLRIATFFIKAMETAGALSPDGFLRHKAETERISAGRSNGQPARQGNQDGQTGVTRHDAREEKQLPSERQEDDDQDGIVVWKYPFKGKMLRIETPENISKELCEKLQRYIDVLKPSE